MCVFIFLFQLFFWPNIFSAFSSEESRGNSVAFSPSFSPASLYFRLVWPENRKEKTAALLSCLLPHFYATLSEKVIPPLSSSLEGNSML